MIKGLKLQNFKCFDSVEIPLNRLTLLAGANGSGKSTIIQALLLIAQSCQERKKPIEIELLGRYINLGYSNDILNERCDDEDMLIEIRSSGGSARFHIEYESGKLKMPVKDDEKSIGGVEVGTLGGIEYISANRINPEQTFSLLTTDRTLGIHGENTMNYLVEHGNQPISEKICVKDVGNTLVEQLNNRLGLFFQGYKLSVTEALTVDMISLRFQEVSPHISDDRRPINVGFGITYVLPVLVALLKAEPESLVIIENPESHLHPRAQKLVGEMIAKVAATGVQVIVETHSDHVLNGIRIAVKEKMIKKEDTQLLFTVRENVGKYYHTNIYAPNILDNGDLDEWPEGFFDEWDNALINLLG